MSEANNEDDKQFSIQKLYVKDVSYETSNTPQIFTDQWQPDINMNLNSESTPLGENIYEVVLNITVTAKVGEKNAYLVEVQQAGIFTIAGFDEEELKPMLGAFCPTTIYPFARETIADLVQRGGFPPLILAPINFDALYAKRSQQAEMQAGGADQPLQ